jgi:hypothetical protein
VTNASRRAELATLLSGAASRRADLASLTGATDARRAELSTLRKRAIPPQEEAKKNRRRTTYWASDPEQAASEYLDEQIVADNAELAAQVDLETLVGETQLLIDALADAVTVEVHDLDVHVVIDSLASSTTCLASAEVGETIGQLDASTSSSAPSVGVDALDTDVTVVVPGDDD